MGGIAMATERSKEPEVGSKVNLARMRIMPEVETGSDGIGSDGHVVCGGKPLTSRKKGSRAPARWRTWFARLLEFV